MLPPTPPVVSQRRSFALYGLIFAGLFLLWGTPVVYPIKVLVVLLHEISHGLMAVLTGGSIERIEINADQGGVCYTRGGIRFLTLSAGYLGSMLFGALILIVASRSKNDRQICAGLGIFLVAITLLFIRNQFGFVFGLLAGGSLAIGARYLSAAFAVDLAPKRSTGAVMGIIGIFSYIGAAVQEGVSGFLIHRGTTMVDGVRHYDFAPAVAMWIGASVLSLVIALSLWRAKPVD